MDKFIGKRLDGRYEISELIGVGGMAVVYKAYDNVDDRIVAIKILKDEFLANDEFRKRFKNESKAIAVLSHPNIVKVYDVSFGDVIQYIVMEYINGITLKKYIEKQGIVDWKEAIHFCEQILKALRHAHEKGIIHRDIKPQNIMLLPDGTIKVTDFGIARFSRSEQKTITDKAIGSVHYISPEQARGDFTDGKADIYSVGVLLYEMITGKVPFQAESAVSVAIMQLQNDPVSPCEINSLIPKGLEQITIKAMQKEPSNRYLTADDMLTELQTVAVDPTVVFNHEFVVDTQPTKHIDIKKEKVSDYAEEEKERSMFIPILSGVAAVFVIGIIVALVFIMRSFNTGEAFDCPNLVGEVYNEIKDDYNLKVDDDSYNYNSEYENGVIYKQDPEPGKKIKEKSEIYVYISLGAKQITLENYKGFEFSLVEEELAKYDISVKKVEIESDEIAKGLVIETIPPANTLVSSGDEITVYVSAGEEVINVKVPNLSGLNEEAAKKSLESNGLKLGNKTEKSDPNVAKGIVIGQSVDATSEIAMGSSVDIVISAGPEETTVVTTTEEKTEATTKPKLTLNIELPNTDEELNIVGYLNGNQIFNETKKYASSYTAVIDIGEGTDNKLVIEINDKKYLEYTIDFDSYTWTVTEDNRSSFEAQENSVAE